MILSKTALGQQVFKDRSVSLTPQQRSALILVDNKRSTADILNMTAAVGVTMSDIDALMALGLVQNTANLAEAAIASAPNISAELPTATASATTQNPGIDFQAVLNETILVCSNLGFKGFGLNMALTGVDSLEKLQKLAPEIRRAAGDAKYKPLHQLIFGKPL